MHRFLLIAGCLSFACHAYKRNFGDVLLASSKRKMRELSREDAILWKGAWNVSVPPQNFSFIHIPKTAGSSFMRESPNHLPIGSTLHGNGEKDACHTRRLPTVVLLRSPDKHVYSQFLECKYDRWGKRVTDGTSFPRGNMSRPVSGFNDWLQHSVNQTGDDYGCYHPRNLQTRYLSCIPGSRNPHHYAPPNLNKALLNLNLVKFVGIADYYKQSVCAFEVYVAGKTKCWCDKKGGLQMGSPEAHIVHTVPPHSMSDVSENSMRMIKNLTRYDEKLYEEGLARFWADLNDLSETSGVDLKCANEG